MDLNLAALSEHLPCDFGGLTIEHVNGLGNLIHGVAAGDGNLFQSVGAIGHALFQRDIALVVAGVFVDNLAGAVFQHDPHSVDGGAGGAVHELHADAGQLGQLEVDDGGGVSLDLNPALGTE